MKIFGMLARINVMLVKYRIYFILLLFKEPIQLKRGDTIATNFWRSMGQNKVWYEWSVSKPTIKHIHNLKGMHYVIHL